MKEETKVIKLKSLKAFKDQITMTTVDIAERTGKRPDNVLRDARKLLVELYGEEDLLKFEEIYKDKYNRDAICYRLPKREILILISGYSIPLRAAIIDRVDELERSNGLPDFNDPVAAARAWADESERRRIEAARADEAIRTKAYISDKKTATAMATASAKSRENEKLRTQIGNAKNWKQVKAIKWLSQFFVLDKRIYSAVGKELAKLSRAMDMEIKKIEDSVYDSVNAYHIDVINRFQALLEDDIDYMSRYRNYL